MQLNHVGLIGYGEVGKTFALGLLEKSGVVSVAAWDLKLSSDAPLSVRQAELAHAKIHGIQATHSMAALCVKCQFIISAVTASNTLAVAQEAAKYLQPGTVFLDLNSASPGTKQACSQLIEAAGGLYVEAGVMTSVPPYGIRVPMLLGGTSSKALADKLQSWGLDAKSVSDTLGVASAIKMSRSVMIKGLEALVIESYATARAYGVEDHVLPTLQETFPQIDWAQQGAYFFSRVVQHGKRRSEEMREAANTVKEAGFEPFMAMATADKQQWVADLAAQGVFSHLPKDATWQAYADCLLAAKKDT
jgi:3-hydroxyisobutyrate dehydrogenase-like beta-hydroxyacid dehydrogenase